MKSDRAFGVAAGSPKARVLSGQVPQICGNGDARGLGRGVLRRDVVQGPKICGIAIAFHILIRAFSSKRIVSCVKRQFGKPVRKDQCAGVVPAGRTLTR